MRRELRNPEYCALLLQLHKYGRIDAKARGDDGYCYSPP